MQLRAINQSLSSCASAASLNPLQRDCRIDALRGICLIVMTCKHLPKPLHAITYQPPAFVSAAEVFVFLSGLVSACAHVRVLIRLGFRPTVWGAWGRVTLLYRIQLGP